MLPNLRNFSQKYHNVLLFIAFAVLAYTLVVVIVQQKLKDLHHQIQIQISEQQTLLTTIAETTARNGADKTTEAIVRDCNLDERNQFDTLLGKLDKGLPASELTTLQRLFARCGSFYPQRKSVMVARFTREIEVYESYVDQLKAVSDQKTIDSYQVDTWKQLAQQEQKQSELFTKLLSLQGNIIETLISGKSPESEEIKSVLKQVKETQVSLTEANQNSTDIRKTLIPL
jgi:hypothetical protein